MTGPNTALGHGGSFITILEYQIRYVMDLISTMIERGSARWRSARGARRVRPRRRRGARADGLDPPRR